jgi:MoaA/NifB/PqqE/SkfB family radical SAM enzyme/predicted SAM-dependent methyltransferase
VIILFPEFLMIRLTTNCNAQCKMCNIWTRPEENIHLNSLFKIMHLFNKNGTNKFIFTGGEPILHPKFKEINKFIMENNMEFALITNGSLLTDNWDKIFPYKLPSYIIFSVDSLKENYHNKNRNINDLVKKVKKSILKTIKYNIPFSINTVIGTNNFKDIIEIYKDDTLKNFSEWNLIPIKFCKDLELNIDNWKNYHNMIKNKLWDNRIISTFNFKENINYKKLSSGDYTSKFYSKNKCRIYNKILFLESDLNLYRCNCFDFKDKEIFKVSNLRKDSKKEILKNIKSLKEEYTMCKHCDHRNQNFNKNNKILEFWAKKAFCPICNKDRYFGPFGEKSELFNKFNVIGGGYRPNAVCLDCGIIHRTTSIYLYLKNILKKNKQLNILHIAPEEIISKLINNYKNINYIAGDLNPKENELLIDIRKTNFEDNKFDLIICNHVLEHIIEDNIAMSEIYRILKKNGIAILQVPYSYDIEKSIEKNNNNKDNLKHFGQSDHIRLYAYNDYIKRLKKSGFKVQTIDNQKLIKEKNKEHNLLKGEKIFICKK